MIPPDAARRRLPDSRIFSFYSYKGGVGRTMALANVASLLARNSPGSRILCLDLDLEAPGLPAYLPPSDQSREYRGFIGLVVDILRGGGGPESQSQRLRKGLTNEEEGYFYRVSGTENLFVLPVGDTTSRERWDAMEWLHRRLHPARRKGLDGDEVGSARALVPELNLLREIVREEYLYSLIDSRTGLADEAFATTVVLADALVLVFRPNSTQLLGIQAVLSRFLAEHGLFSFDGKGPEPPVVPVISPRPPYSDPRVATFRRIAVEEVFPWLASPLGGDEPLEVAGGARGDIVELPYDVSLEVGETLLVPSDPRAVTLDAEAPLVRAYTRLATRVGQLNLANDVYALMQEERILLLRDQHLAAFELLLTRIQRDPHDGSAWLRVSVYLGTIKASEPDRKRAFDIFGEILTRHDAAVPRFFALLWMSELEDDSLPARAVVLIRRAWDIAQESGDPLLVDPALARAHDFARDYPEIAESKRMPAAAIAAEGLAWMRLDQASTGDASIAALQMLARAYSNVPDRGNSQLHLLDDLISLSAASAERSALLQSLAETHISRCEFPQALSALAAAAAEDPEPQVLTNFALLAMCVSDWSAVRQEVTEYSASLSDALDVLTAARFLEPTDDHRHIQEQIKRLAGVPTVGPVIPETYLYAFALRQRYDDALSLILNRELMDQFDGLQPELITLLYWLGRREGITPVQSLFWLRNLQRRGLSRFSPLNAVVLAAFAGDPEGVVKLAHEKLQSNFSMWPFERLHWLLLASVLDETGRHSEDFREMLRCHPLVPLYLQRDPDFLLLPSIVDRHHREGRLSPHQALRFRRLLDEVITWSVQPLSVLPTPRPADPDFTTRDRRAAAVRERWVENLRHVSHDPSVGRLLAVRCQPEAVFTPLTALSFGA